jgi:hypothetical protein
MNRVGLASHAKYIIGFLLATLISTPKCCSQMLKVVSLQGCMTSFSAAMTTIRDITDEPRRITVTF